MTYNDGNQFTTTDRDNDGWSSHNCAEVHTNVLRCTAGVGGGMIGAPMPISMVCTTTHPGPQISLGFTGRGGMVINIPYKQQL